MSEVRHFAYEPEGRLRRYVREILHVRSERARVQVLLPETTLALVLRQSGLALVQNQSLPHAIVSGLQEQTRLVEHAARSSLVIVRFTEVGAAAMLHDRVDLLYDQTIALDNLLPRQEIERVQNILADTGDVRRQVLSVERFLTSRIRAEHAISPQIELAAQMIRISEGRSSITTIVSRKESSDPTFGNLVFLRLIKQRRSGEYRPDPSGPALRSHRGGARVDLPSGPTRFVSVVISGEVRLLFCSFDRSNSMRVKHFSRDMANPAHRPS